MKISKFKLFIALGAYLAMFAAIVRIATAGNYPLAALLLFIGLAAFDTIVIGLGLKGPVNFSGRLNAVPAALGSATLNYQLTAYAQGLWNDITDVVKLAERLAPTTPVPGASGQFKKFDDKNSFMAEKTARALGGDPVLLAFNASDDAYSCKPQALEVRVDKEEDQASGDAGGDVQSNLLDQGKIRALVNKVALSHVLDVGTFVLNNVAAQNGVGNWTNPDIDPIDQINAQLLGISGDCGSVQNVKITMDLSTWNTLRSHPKVKARALFGAASSLASISTDQLNAALLYPVDIMVSNVVYDTTRLNQASVKSRVMLGNLLIHYSVPNATIYDPSAFKCFTVGAAGFLGNVRTYVAPNQLWRGHLVDWSRDIKLTSTLSMRRIVMS